MSPTVEPQRDAASDESELIQIPVADLVIALWERRFWLAKVIGIGLLVSTGLALLAFLIPNEYSSTARLMPPGAQTFNSTSALSLLSGPSMSSLGMGLLGESSPGAITIGVLESRTIQDDIINRLDLRRVYDRKLYEDARKILKGRTKLDEDKKTGIISITVEDHDRYRARNIAQAYVDELNNLVSSLSTSSAHRERIFLEGRLQSVKADLDADSHALTQFSSRNATFDPSKQGEATVQAATKLQGELISAQSELSSLRAAYADDNVRVRQIRARVEELQNELRKMSGGKAQSDGVDLKQDGTLPSIRQLPLLGYTYYDLYRKVTINENLYESLSKQYEFAKVEEAKEIPSIKVLDVPNIPEKKSGPHRTLIVIIGFILSLFGGITWILTSTFWRITGDSSALKQNIMTIYGAIRGKSRAASIVQPGDTTGSAGEKA